MEKGELVQVSERSYKCVEAATEGHGATEARPEDTDKPEHPGPKGS